MPVSSAEALDAGSPSGRRAVDRTSCRTLGCSPLPSTRPPRSSSVSDDDARGHRAARLQATFVPGDPVPAAGHLALWGVDDLDEIADVATDLGLPPGEAGTLAAVIARGDELEPADVPARLVPVLPAARILAAMPPGPDWQPWRRPSDAVLAWSVAAKLALEYVTAGRVIPMLRVGERARTALAAWHTVPTGDGRLPQLAGTLPPAAHALRIGDDTTVWAPLDLLEEFCDAIGDVCAREGRRPTGGTGRARQQRPWTEVWAEALSGADPVVTELREPSSEVVEALRNWAAPVLGRDLRSAVRLRLWLEPPDVDDAAGVAPDVTWQLHTGLQATEDPDAVVDAASVWAHPGGALELAGRQVGDPHEKLATGIAQAARLFRPLEALLRQARPTGIGLDAQQVTELLDAADELIDAGIALHLPEELQALDQRKLRPRLRVGGDVSDPGDIDKQASGLFDADTLSDYRFELALGDQTISTEELARLRALGQPLVRWQGEWVRIDTADVDQLVELQERTGQLELVEALVAALSGRREISGLGAVETVADGEVAALIEQLRESEGPVEPDLDRFEGDLRPYQERGVAWLQTHGELGLGAVLADEMGLGKTVMAAAVLGSRAQDRAHLVVCPTSVVGNWERELNRFVPDVPVVRYHGPDRPRRLDAFPPGGIAVTNYALLRRDVDLLTAVPWDTVVFDEAQQIKNVASKGAKAARELPARVRIALTGTPIENRLSELWAILDLTNPGLMGPLSRFTEQYAVPIERWGDQETAARLRRLIAPFVMRRVKSDPEVSVDLPPKQEVRVTCSLTPEQARLYQRAVDEAFSGGRLSGDGFGRKGRILALLTALKQICNHPAHYLDQQAPLAGRSGKLTRTVEILQEVLASGDHALVFTQYRKMGDLLGLHLSEQLDLPEIPFLHGSVPAHRRDQMVSRFQEDEDAPPILLVSLRAGGTGLNLTRATEVLHFDRWWNPAVEDQATDRVHRIGQTRPVTVHTLVTGGTVEERIAELLERKRELAQAVVGEGEAWITELGDEELRDLVALSTEDVEDDLEGAA
ncbi:MAG: DEAD/DEAH box helicase [Actinobacteria bacterium]|nr:DEAD/DEAH box helicase [Actinomycetota bacterium]